MKTWKIILLIITVLIVLFIGFVVYNGYNYSKFYDEVENMGSVRFGTELFNKKLQSCDLAYADTWEIRGLENDLCVVVFNWDSDINYDEGTISSNLITCELPYDVYVKTNNIDWNKLINENYCQHI